MSLATRCPYCSTAFRVSPEQLQVHRGQVRCGRCAQVFDGYHALSAEEAPQAEAAAPSAAIAAPAAKVPDGPAAPNPPVAPNLSAAPRERPPMPPAATLTPPATPAPTPPATAAPANIPAPARSVAAEPAYTSPPALPRAVPAAPPPPPEPSLPELKPAIATVAPAPELEPLESFTLNPPPESVSPPRPEVEPPSPFMLPDEAARAAPRRGWVAGMLGLALLLALQGVYYYRGQLSVQFPALRAPLKSVCNALRCTVAPPQRIAQISIEASDMQATEPGNPGLIRLSATLHNHADVEVGYPALDVVLTDTQDHTLARRIFSPADYLSGGVKEGIAANGEASLQIMLDTGALGAAGFRLDLLRAR